MKFYDPCDIFLQLQKVYGIAFGLMLLPFLFILAVDRTVRKSNEVFNDMVVPLLLFILLEVPQVSIQNIGQDIANTDCFLLLLIHWRQVFVGRVVRVVAAFWEVFDHYVFVVTH